MQHSPAHPHLVLVGFCLPLAPWFVAAFCVQTIAAVVIFVAKEMRHLLGVFLKNI